jgi:hypothetical protein
MKTHIVIHHSASKDGAEYNWGAIRKFHMAWRHNGNIITQEEGIALQLKDDRTVVAPWRDIGYHFGIEDVAGRLEILLGRMPEDSGAHCPELDMNRVGIGICCVGNFDAQVPTNELLSKLAILVKWLMERYSIPAKNVWGHREAQAAGGTPPEKRKSCPGTLFDMDRLRAML